MSVVLFFTENDTKYTLHDNSESFLPFFVASYSYVCDLHASSPTIGCGGFGAPVGVVDLVGLP